MSANIEYQVICKIIETRDFHTVVKLKIDESFFLVSNTGSYVQPREAFRFIRDHYHNTVTHGSVPSWDIFNSRFPWFPWTYSYDDLPTLLQELRRQKIRADVLTLADQLMLMADSDPHVAMNAVKNAAIQFTSDHEISSDLLLSAAHEKLYQEYEMIANQQGLLGIPWPWDILNDDTQGIQKGQFIVLYGRPKSMKTWIGLFIACYAYLKGARVLIYSLEMLPKQIQKRCAAIIAGVEYDKFKNAKLDPASHQRVFQTLWDLQAREQSSITEHGHVPAILATKPDGNGSGVSQLQAKIREFQPDLVLVDGMYLMKDDRTKVRTIDWKAIAHISQDLKNTASLYELPIIGITQANRGADKDPKKADLTELAYADALAQDCDVCIRVTKQKDQQTHSTELVLSFPGMREGTLEAFVIHGEPAVNFNFKRATITDPNAPPPSNGGGGGGGQGGGGRGGGGSGTPRGGSTPILPAGFRPST